MLKHLYLLGFMGCGKSTVGPILAARMNRPFTDLDELVEKEQQMTIREIFALRGEAFFRKLESDLLLISSKLPASVIALGGGTFSYPTNREVILGTGVAIWLRISLETARQRCEQITTRPLARDEKTFKALFAEREQYYSLAHLTVDAEWKSPPQISDEIVQKAANLGFSESGGGKPASS